jgi:hypothetical protein
MRRSSKIFMMKELLALTLVAILLLFAGCKAAEDTNRPPVVTAIKAMMGGSELTQLSRDTTVTLRVEYTDEDYSSNGTGDVRFAPDIMWSARFDGTSTPLAGSFIDPTINNTVFKVPDQPGTLRIEVVLTDRYGDSTKSDKLVEIAENQPPLLQGFTVDGDPVGDLIAQVQRDDRIELGIKYIDDDYDPNDPGHDPLHKPTFLWYAEWKDTGTSLDDSFFDRTTNPTLFDTPVTTGFIEVSVVVTDRDGASSDDSFIIEISENEPPEITGLDIGTTVFHVSTEKTFKVTASDPDDPTGTLTYLWEADGGQFNTLTTLSEAKWEAKEVGKYLISITVTDEDGGWGRQEFTVEATNQAPEITGYQIDDKNPTPGTVVNITLNVTDPDAEDSNLDLTYEWSANGGGFASETVTDTGATAQWVAPPTEGPYVVSVTVRDPWGGSDTLNLPPITVEKQ